MGKRKVSILEPAATAVAEVAWFVESKGMPATAKKFVDEAFHFFQQLSDDTLEHRPCKYLKWKQLGYRCVNFRRKYIIAYLSLEKEVIICDFVSSKLLK